MSPEDRRARVAEIAADDELLGRGVLVAGWPHEAPDGPMSVEAAHQAMQGHALCARNTCARKRAAHRVLIEAGHLTPDPRTASGPA